MSAQRQRCAGRRHAPNTPLLPLHQLACSSECTQGYAGQIQLCAMSNCVLVSARGVGGGSDALHQGVSCVEQRISARWRPGRGGRLPKQPASPPASRSGIVINGSMPKQRVKLAARPPAAAPLPAPSPPLPRPTRPAASRLQRWLVCCSLCHPGVRPGCHGARKRDAVAF